MDHWKVFVKMKKFFVAQIVTLIICFAWVGAAGQNPSDIELEGDPLDVFGKLTNEDLAGRIDNLFVTLSNFPENYIAYVVFYPGEDVAEKSRKSTEKYFWRHVKFRKFDSSRIVVIHGEIQPMEETQFWIAHPDAKPPKLEGAGAELVDSLEGYNEEALYAAVDRFFSKLSKDRNNRGYIQVYVGVSNPPSIWNKRRTERTLLRYISSRRFRHERVTFVRAGFLQNDFVEFWIVPPGAEPPPILKGMPEPKLDVSKTILFDRRVLDSVDLLPFTIADSTAELNLEWTGDAAGLGEIDPDNLPSWVCEEFAKTLFDRKDTRGYLIFYADPRDYDIKGLEGRFAEGIRVMDEAIGENGRIELIYGGNRDQTQIEYFIGPKGGARPLPSPSPLQK